MSRMVKAFAPATVANASAGFDVLGFALENPGDTITCSLRDEPGIVITGITGVTSDLPTDPDENTAGVAVQALLKKYDLDPGIEMQIEKGIPIVGGMGSSASSAVAALVAVNELLDLNLRPLELLPFVLESEKMATGAPHADNAAPALLGGFSVIRDSDGSDVLSIPVPVTMTCAIVHPHMQIKTRDARDILPKEVPMRSATRQMGHMAGLILGLVNNDPDLIRRSLVDELAEPHRGKLIPGYEEVREAARKAGALGCGISGSGPSMYALCDYPDLALSAGQAMQEAFSATDLQSDLFVSAISQSGAHVIASE